MTYAARTDPALFFFLVFVTLLLVLFIGAVIVAPAATPDSPAPLAVEPLPPPPVRAPAPPPLPRRQPQAAATTAGAARWSAGAEAATDIIPMPVYRGVRRPEVSGGPPWGPAVKPPGPDPWAAENLSPGWLRGPDEALVSPRADRPVGSKPPPRTPVPAGNQTSHRRHGRRR
jgi:hypothetical protein